MNQKKVIHLISSLKIGGAEAWLIDLLQHLPADIEHHVIFFHDGSHRNTLEQLGIKNYHIRGSFCSYDPLFLWRLYKTIKHINPHLIHSSLWAANFLGRVFAYLLDIPIICSIHSQLKYNFDGPIRTFIDRISFDLADHIVPVSSTVEQSILAKSLIAHHKVTLIKNGIDSARIQHQKHTPLTKLHLGVDPHDFIIGSVGRFIKLKNFSWLIEQMVAVKQQLPHTKLLLLGFGPEEQALRDLTKKLNLEDEIIFIIGQSAASYYHLMDCFVMPSEQEGLSIALLEAMSTGLPCIVANKTNNHDVIIDNHNGFLIKTDENSFLKKIIDLARNRELRKTIGNNARTSAMQEFSIQHMTDAYYQLYKQYL